MMGIVLASPFLQTQPLLAGGLALGSALPDLDALSRLFGKRAFLRAHQTYSHSLPLIALLGLPAFPLARAFDSTLAPFVLGTCLGMGLHALLDVCNTYGITLFAPFSHRRLCLEWVFFVDAVVFGTTLAAFVFVARRIAADQPVEGGVVAGYAASMLVYFGAKGWLRRRAARFAPRETLALIPSSAFPWRYFGCSRCTRVLRLFRVNALTGRCQPQAELALLDEEWSSRLDEPPEVLAMRALTPAYHLVSAQPLAQGSALTRLVWRDLRTRNFDTRFGSLELVLAPDGRVLSKDFHV